ncbi:hypothetical protein [uncultured Treponema sp.]|uniref:hypothetical protein n=1 Tax=uncultured Treponema sp. TaxID=162155 RepID=UPI0015B8BEC9|nr:hypothetical protein [uncultured Treponema sp.]
MAVQKNIEEKKTKTEEKITKTVKVKILETLRGTYGAFNPGEIAEIGENLACELIKAGLAEKA